MRSWRHPFLLSLIVCVLLLGTAGVACLIHWLTGKFGLIVFFAVPALAMLTRALYCRETRPGLWSLLGIAFAPLVWIALPVAISMIFLRREASAPE